MKLCLEEMALDRQEVADEVVAEASVQEEVLAGWEVIVLEQDPEGRAFALIAERGYHIR